MVVPSDGGTSYKTLAATETGMQLAIVSDTHIPSRASEIPQPFVERIQGADHVIHAGDFDSKGAVSNISNLATELTAVSGNMDPHVGFPRVVRTTLGSVEFVITHGIGPKHNHTQRVLQTVSEEANTDNPVGVTGHTHEVLDTKVDGIRLLNPGTATGAAPAKRKTMMTATVDAGKLTVSLHELE